ncbi:MAG: NAD(P)-dependent oxidoreductase [Rhodospirillaceae bacterium]|jgi:GlcNAc-P-P-Und epimerase|nr:NAD(P)-dependent oxidoreductase [Rhodospirillaceae bacterium]MBT5778881.1 NAD(P)-dependent oxidoreductase [Rhodospirillaceae bacterium]MBT6830720.1 NAD(P)-dependent oxidoreductase [Rhodospirillaceae bacterium]MBT7292600.1 NAD(P)-dependent oxidoreductase [Rhodospirillaceae bacterium]
MRLLVTGASGFIGTNVIEYFKPRAEAVVNVDVLAPRCTDQQDYWRKADICDRKGLVDVFTEFAPTHVLHLAARTGMGEFSSDHFAANTAGVENVIHAAKEASTVKRMLFASSLLVCRNGHVPARDDEYCPDNMYGESKVEGERIVRKIEDGPFTWAIFRPSSTWGPWFELGYHHFFKLVMRGLYFHPGRIDIVKPTCFAGNAAYMMDKMLCGSPEDVHGKIFYLVDYPEHTTRQWAEEIRRAVGRRPLMSVPMPVLSAAAKCGDMAKLLGWREPYLTSFRLSNMMTGGRYPFEPIEALAGPLPATLADGVEQTIAWMRSQTD